ncbi:hypothetical protein [Salinispira pacifica]
MRKIPLLIALLLALLAFPLFAQLRVDFGVDVPWGLGAAASDFAGNDQSTQVDLLSSYVFLLPEGSLLYQFPVGPVNLGVGARAFTLVVETLVYPNLLAEVNLGPLAVDLNVGGGAFLFFGVYNNLSASSVVIPDLSAYFKIAKILRLGIGGTLFYSSDLYSSSKTLPWMVYLAARISLTF